MTVYVSIRTNNVGSECETEFEIDEQEWNSMTSDEREEMCKGYAFDMMEWNFKTERE
jgi:hypothetical protein